MGKAAELKYRRLGGFRRRFGGQFFQFVVTGRNP
jgi:hypothetical protein